MPLGQEIANGTAVAGDKALETPVVAQDVLLVAGITTARLSVDALIGAHHLGDISLLYQCLEGRQIGFPQVAFGQLLNVEGVAVPFWTAVYGEVLGTGQKLFVFVLTSFSGQTLSLQAVDYSQSHAFCQIGVFAVGLLSASPARITEDVDVRRPERQTLIALDSTVLLGFLVFGTCLVADCRENLIDQLVVPRCRHHGGNGEYGGEAVSPYAVQGFAPPLELGDAQPWYGWRRVHHQLRLLFEGQTT